MNKLLLLSLLALQGCGLIASTINTVSPESAWSNPEVVKPAPVDPQYLTLDYARLVPLLVEAIKEQQILINNLSKKVNG